MHPLTKRERERRKRGTKYCGTARNKVNYNGGEWKLRLSVLEIDKAPGYHLQKREGRREDENGTKDAWMERLRERSA